MLHTAERLSLDALMTLLRGGALAVRIPAYWAPSLCAELCDELLTRLHGDKESYRRIYLSDVPAFTETLRDPRMRMEYLRDSAVRLDHFREACMPLGSPTDRLRCELDELWPAGAGLLRIEGRPIYFGIMRVWDAQAEALPHFDVINALSEELKLVERFSDQLGVNLFLRGSSEGGEFEAWDLNLSAVRNYREGVVGTYGFPRSQLPAPDVKIKPSTGDLFLVKTTKLHAVRPTRRGERVTLSGFVGYQSTDHPLRLWS